jgi:hypothetical protein
MDDIDAEIAYHRGQQEMVNAYFEQWRLEFPNPQRNEFFEHISAMSKIYFGV